MHKHSQTLTPTGRESPQTEAFGDQHGIELREYQHGQEYGQEHQHGDQHQFASGGAHRLPPETTNGTRSGSTDSEHLVGEATLGLQPGQELRLKIPFPVQVFVSTLAQGDEAGERGLGEGATSQHR